MYAVIVLQWHQYIVKEGDEIVVDRMSEEEGSSVKLENVACVFTEDGSTVSIWAPYIKASVTAKVIEHKKWKKLRSMKFQGKKRYKRVVWFRPYQTVLSIEKVSS